MKFHAKILTHCATLTMLVMPSSAATVAALFSFESAGNAEISVATGGQQNSSVQQAANQGAGSSGGLQWSANGGAVDHRYFGIAPVGAGQTVDATMANQYTSAVKLNYSDIDNIGTNLKGKAQIRLGFISDTSFTDPTKPQDVWKQQAGFHTDFKIEWNNNGTQPKISLETKFYPTTGSGGTEIKALKFENAFTGSPNTPLQNAESLTGWYEVELVAARVGLTNDYNIAASVYNIGSNGLSSRSLVGSSNFSTALTNAPFSADTTVYPVLFLEGEKNLSAGNFGSSFVVDDWKFQVNAIPEPAIIVSLGLAGAFALLRRRRIAGDHSFTI